MRDREERYPRPYPGPVAETSTAERLKSPLPRLTAAAAAATFAFAVLAVGALAGTSSEFTSGLMTSSADTWWTMVERHNAPPLHHRRHRPRRHRQRHRPRPAPPISGFDRFPGARNVTTSGRRRFRHIDDKSTSGGSDAAAAASGFKVVADPAIVRETDDTSGRSIYFRFCDQRLVSSALDPVNCQSRADSAVRRRCLVELAALDHEAEVKFQLFKDFRLLFDCRHSYSLASDCEDCEVRTFFAQ